MRRLVAPGLALVLGTVAWQLGSCSVTELRSWQTHPATVDSAVATLAMLLTAAICAWLLLGVLVTIWAAPSGARVSGAWLPNGLRRTVMWSVGAGVMLGVAAGPATAATAPTPVPSGSVSIDAGLVPSGNVGTQKPTAPTTSTVTVRKGDTLWGLAKSRLSRPSDAEVAKAWPAWYQANRSVIGSDPDLLHPGQTLKVPGR